MLPNWIPAMTTNDDIREPTVAEKCRQMPDTNIKNLRARAEDWDTVKVDNPEGKEGEWIEVKTKWFMPLDRLE